MQERKAEYVP
jgi:hypothetical protein